MPKFEAKRMLLIGLGSTGNQILNEVQDKIRWEFGDPNAMSWVRYLGIETHTGTRELPPTDTVYITLEENEYQTVLRTPEVFQEQLHLQDWLDMPRIRSAGMTSVKTGAGNNRMIGRLAFFSTRNFTAIRDNIQQRVNQLNQLGQIEAQKTLSDAFSGAPWEVAFDDPGIEIITVGTLCGGTCSGIFLDFGYLLRRLNRDMGLSADTRAILTLPHTGVTNTLHGANAYSALMELDYFSDTVNTYYAKYPDLPNRTDHIGQTPYDRAFLIESGGIDQTATTRLNNVAAQYIYARLMFRPVREKTDGSAIDPVANHFEQVSLCGAPQRYYTFGLANLEYPTTQIRRACSARLAGAALGSWLSPYAAPVDAGWMRQIQVEPGILTNRLLDRSGSAVTKAVEDAVRNYARRSEQNLSLLAEMESGLPAVFDAVGPNEPTFAELEPSLVRKTVEGNWKTVYAAVRQEWQARVERVLSGSDSGDIRCGMDRVLKEAQAAFAWLQQETKRLQEKQAAASQRSASDEMMAQMRRERTNARAVGDDPLLGIALWKSQALRHHIQRAEKFALRYVQERAQFVVEAYGLTALYQELEGLARRIIARIESGANPTGVQATVQRLHEHFQSDYTRLASTVPNTPGRVVFTPKDKNDQGNNTVDIAAERTMTALGASTGDFNGLNPPQVEQRLHQKLIVRWMTDQRLTEELFREPASYWDVVRNEQELEQRRQINPRDLRLLEELTRDYFAAILNRSIVDEIGAQQMGALLPQVDQEADLQLPLNLGDPCHENDVAKSWKYLFHPSTEHNADVQGTLVASLAPLHIRNGAVEYGDLRRIAILQERCAFPLSTLTGLDRLEDLYSQLRNQGKDLHNRADIVWAGIIRRAGQKQDLLRAEQLFVTAVALEVVQYLGLGATKPYRFTYPAFVGAMQTKELPADLRRAAYDLDLDSVVYTTLQKQTLGKIQELGVSTAAMLLRDFINAVGAPADAQARRQFRAPLPLYQKGDQVIASRLYGAIEAYLVDNAPPTYQQLIALMGSSQIRSYTFYPQGTRLPDGTEVRQPGFYCLCNQRLAPPDGEAHIPTSCPLCGRKLVVNAIN